MPANIIASGAIPNYPGPPSKSDRKAAQEVINKLDYSDIWRGSGTISKNKDMRLDMQGTIKGPPEMQNLQVQINGKSGKSTVAHANVCTSLQTHDAINQKGVANKVNSALQQSLDHGQSFVVSGSIP